MSTRSRIAVLQENGKVKSIYCHSDGYLKGVGQTLLTFYNTYERANAIIALGDLSELHKNLTPLPEAPEAFYFGQGKPEMLTTHSYQRPQENVTIAFHRDRKEKMYKKMYSSLEHFYEKGAIEIYNYLFRDGKWYVMRRNYLKDSEWSELTHEVIKSEK